LQWTETPRVSATEAQQRSLAETEDRKSQFAEIELQPLETIALNTSLRNAKLSEIITLSGFHTNEAFLNNRDFLRDATNDVHQSLDSRMGEVGIFDTAKNYRAFLQCMAAMHREFGAAVEAVANLAGLPRRANVLTECFINDLASTSSQSGPDTNADWRTLCTPSVRDAHCGVTAFDWGCAYAIEGSAVGGSFMQKAAKTKLPAGLEHQYLNQLSTDAKNRWAVFIEQLNQQTALDRDELKRGGIEVFAFVKKQADTLFNTTR